MFEERPLTPGMGKVRTPVAGVGINDSWYATGYLDKERKKVTCPYYATWSGMLERIFSAKFHERQPTYKECTVEESWKVFSNFRQWMKSQDWEGKALDKDLLIQGNKHYGPHTCIFVPTALNGLLALRANARGVYPLGVTRSVNNGNVYFTARCCFYGKQKTIGSYKTPEEASAAYIATKLKYIQELAAAEKNPKIRDALLRISLP